MTLCLMCLKSSEEACVAGVQGSRGKMGGGEGRKGMEAGFGILFREMGAFESSEQRSLA